MTPYYEQDGITIYHQDCRVVMAEWEGLRTQSFDLLLTDPPYGISAERGQQKRANRQNGNALAQSRDYGVEIWDHEPAHEAIAVARRLCRQQIVFGGNYYDLPLMRGWLVWDKDNGNNNYADCELAWTNLDQPIRKLTYRWHGMFQEPGCRKEYREHPTQKPEPVIRWALMQVPKSQTVLDPFMGSGTTLVAAKRLGKQATGIEREERYCELAVRRLSQRALPLEMVTGMPA